MPELRIDLTENEIDDFEKIINKAATDMHLSHLFSDLPNPTRALLCKINQRICIMKKAIKKDYKERAEWSEAYRQGYETGKKDTEEEFAESP